MQIRTHLPLLCMALAATLMSGCTPPPPVITPAEGVVLLDGEPLPNALITFAPELDNFGAEMNSTGVTDAKGQFQLTCMFKSEPGAVVANHRVIVTDAPPPPGARGPSQAAQEKLTQYQNSLKNRPIPKMYTAFGTTPLTVQVTADQKVYKLNLTRK